MSESIEEDSALESLCEMLNTEVDATNISPKRRETITSKLNDAFNAYQKTDRIRDLKTEHRNSMPTHGTVGTSDSNPEYTDKPRISMSYGQSCSYHRENSVRNKGSKRQSTINNVKPEQNRDSRFTALIEEVMKEKRNTVGVGREYEMLDKHMKRLTKIE